ncbi:MAG: hypothetical protein ACOC7Y_03205 [Chloroflexota bacterium]
MTTLQTPGWTSKRRIGSVILVTVAAILLTWAVVSAQDGPDFRGTKTGPRFASQGELITYTIDVVNRGDLVDGVVLSDTLPISTTFVTCTYRYVGADWYCKPPPVLWTLNFGRGFGAVTTLVVRVDAVSPTVPVTNEALLVVGDVDVPLGPVTTTLNPHRLYFPVIVRGAAP